VCVGIQRACGGVMRVHVFIGNARIHTRVNAEKHNTPTGLATNFEMSKEKVTLCKLSPRGVIACCAYNTTFEIDINCSSSWVLMTLCNESGIKCDGITVPKRKTGLLIILQ
jgi:hypothetical protein